ncbi:MAG: hypothetical protein M1834_005658 [Cirrosporium novae-zelandiae]|nr:MAG: hypothetical protein M1834_005658 [Cirrosporium novae-zelandiae]
MEKEVNELKQQGVEESARDPNTNTTAEDAEHAIVQETKKAGGAAFQFDPAASPEEKAAQARANVPAGFHRDKKPKGMGIVTDIDNGSGAKYDLPLPTSNSALVATSPSANGSISGSKSPRSPMPDELKFASDRTGWAPRFGNGPKPEEMEDETLLDHQTLLEQSLDDKFYGDWFHNTGVIIFACLSSWIVALFGGGLGWIIMVMVCCGTYYRTSIRRVRRNFRDDITREMAKARLDTDTESLEWINSFLVKFWPIYAPVLCDTIINSVDQVLSASTPAFLDSLRMKMFTLGTKPPRMEHVKTYPRMDDDVVVMDWAFSFTPNDVEDLTAKQLKYRVQPKVVLEVRVGKAMISKGLDVIVEDFAFSGLMRVKVKLQLAFPHIEKVDICFLGRPVIDYVCKPLGGDTLGFDINFIPGLESFIKEMIHGTLEPMMYEPNVFPIEIAKMLAGSPVDQAVGVVAVTIHGAQGLKNPDKFSGEPDPYVVASINNRSAVGRTKTVFETANPRFNETIYVIVNSLADSLTLQVFDYNEYRKDKELGTATFPLDQLEQNVEHENLQLEVKVSGKARGIVQADVRYFPVLEGIKLEDGTQEPPPESNTGIARFTIEQAKELDGSKSLVGQLNPYAVLLLNGKEIHVTRKLKRTNNPIWDNGSKEILITDRKKAKLGLIIKDDRDLAADPILGSYLIKADDMLTMMEKGQGWFNLHGAKKGRAKMSFQWRPVALTGAAGGSGGYITPIGVMRLHFQSAKDLRNFETLGKSDPYVRVLLSGIEKGKTVTFQNNLNPDWDEVIYVPVHSEREKLTLEVMDSESIGKDRSLGYVELSASDYVSKGPTGEYLVHEEKRQMSEPLRLMGKGTPKGVLNFTASFYPTLNVIDPEEEEAEKEAEKTNGNLTPDMARKSIESSTSKTSSENSSGRKLMEKDGEAVKINTNMAKELEAAEKEQEVPEEQKPPKIRIGPEDLGKYESGLIIFKLISATLSEKDVFIEVLMDDMVFPSYVSSKAKSKEVEFGEVGNAFVRELEFSKITLRIREKLDKKGEDDNEEHTIAKLTGPTLQTLQNALYKPTELVLPGGQNKVVVSLRYIPVNMRLDPSESINNMGNLRVDVLDAADLPSADRNGFSDPYCKFELNGKEIYKTKVQKKTLHPSWNEFFEVPVKSRTAADFTVRVMDWDFGDKADLLGTSPINLELLDPFRPQEMKLALDGKSGVLRLRLLFKPDYVTRSRQGSSTFSGTFATPGKVVGGPVKGVAKVGTTIIGGGVKGASFLRHGFSSKKLSKDEAPVSSDEPPKTANGSINGSINPGIETPDGTPKRSIPTIERTPVSPENASNPQSPPQTPQNQAHNRSKSVGSTMSGFGGTPGGAERGTASFTILSAYGYPASTNVRVHIKAISTKGTSKDIHKTKTIKAPTGQVSWDKESFTFHCAADTQFQIQVKDHATFGSDDELGETLFFVDDTSGGSEKTLKVGNGNVTLRTGFTPSDSGSESPASTRGGLRPRSLLNKREVSGSRFSMS